MREVSIGSEKHTKQSDLTRASQKMDGRAIHGAGTRRPGSGFGNGADALAGWLTRRRVFVGSLVVGAWLVVALAWTTPTYLVNEAVSKSHITWGASLVFVTVSFLPWMFVTPGILWLARRFPFATPRRLFNVLAQIGAAVLLIPGITAIGELLTRLVWQPEGGLAHNERVWHYVTNVTIDALYAVPTYIAVVGIAQALAYSQRFRESERLLARTRLQALRSQLNPHFLFNALNAVGTLGYRDPGKADRVLAKLASMLRAGLAERGDEITLKEEATLVTDYVDIYRNLLPQDFKLITDISHDTWNAAIPRMILQPLMENALVHGIANCAHVGTILLRSQRVGNRLVLIIINDGSPGVEDATKGERGIGLSNVAERLRVLYGDKQRLRLCLRESGGATVEIELPYRTLSDAHAY